MLRKRGGPIWPCFKARHGRGGHGEASKMIGAERKLMGREMAEENDWSGQGWRKRMIGGIPHYW